jgi:alpha-beta hydrolase superfamily lysophospholipase
LNYDTLLVDFRGLGGSSGNTTTLGVRETEDVALSMRYAQRSKFKRPFVLYGVSMGSAAILKAVAQREVNPDAIILELPFDRLIDAVKSRLKAFKIPTFPMVELLVFWGGFQYGFNGFH